MRTNGYAHACWINDAGWERCRVCDDADHCDGYPFNQEACVAHAADPDRASCHVGLLQECILQRSLRGPADARVTRACRLSAQACAGQLPGDRSAEALAAQHETDQVTMQVINRELDQADRLQPDSSFVRLWRTKLSAWEGGVPSDEGDASSDGGDSGH
ncbi:hypothetical protein LZC95_48155 [Pendulispora brunnea]|uniref:Uncharacterized protein n=1 Tax=Pendulispora brunnea TaxID=2905690 RepID=A0ABZ2KA22_9BACT